MRATCPSVPVGPVCVILLILSGAALGVRCGFRWVAGVGHCVLGHSRRVAWPFPLGPAGAKRGKETAQARQLASPYVVDQGTTNAAKLITDSTPHRNDLVAR